MMWRISLFLTWLASLGRTDASVRLENLALRHQVAVYKQSSSRPKLGPADRLLWVWLSRLWPGWETALEFVQPRTVLTWQKKRFCDHWQQLSQGCKLGRPTISKDIATLSRDI